MTVYNLFFHKNDLPADVKLGNNLTVDCEMMGLNVRRDRLCLIQIFDNDSKDLHMVHFVDKEYVCPNLKKQLTGDKKHFIGHMIRLDLNWISYYLDVELKNVFCTRTASRIAQTNGASHNLDDLLKNLLGVHIKKSMTTSYWGSEELSQEQINYAAEDVLYLHGLKEKLTAQATKEDRLDYLNTVMQMIPLRVKLDVGGWDKEDILNYPF